MTSPLDTALRELSDAYRLFYDGGRFADALKDIAAAESSLRTLVEAGRRDTERLDFLERGGFTAFRSSVRDGGSAAIVTDCRDGLASFLSDGGRFYAPTLRAAIDAASRPTTEGETAP